MADDERRVSPKPMVVAGGMTATPEGIHELERRRVEAERLARPPPTTSFSSVLKTKVKPVEAKPSRKEEKTAALPKKGPRPGLAHPAQREAFGRDEDEDSVIIKG